MQSTNSIPPAIICSQKVVYASQGDIFTIDADNGTLRQSYPIQGMACPTIMDDMLYLNVSRDPDYIVRALRASDGAALWHASVEGRLSDTPVIADGVVYVSTIEGTVYAFDASDGRLLWRASVDPGPNVPPFLGPILGASPAIGDKVVYVAPAVNAPLEPFVYAFQAADGKLLWKAQIPDSTSFPLLVVDGVIYLSTSSGCVALHGRNGSALWQCQIGARPCSAPVIADRNVYISLSASRYTVSETREFKRWQEAGLCALRVSDGQLLWQRQIGSDTAASSATTPVVAQDRIYVGTDDGYLSALQGRDGTLLWRYKTNGMRLSAPVVADNVVYVGASDGSVYALRADDGALVWQTFVGGKVTGHASLSLSMEEG